MTEPMSMDLNHLMYVISLEKYLTDSESSGEPISSVLNTVKMAVSTRRTVLEAMMEMKELPKTEIN